MLPAVDSAQQESLLVQTVGDTDGFISLSNCAYSSVLTCLIIFSYNLKLPIYCRNTMYDSSMGGCLHLLHSRCPVDVVRSTATDLVNVFPQSLLRTRSQELKVYFIFLIVTSIYPVGFLECDLSL